MPMHVKLRKISYLLHFTPPGFPCSIDVPFPERVLPVCDKCKKNFKTRDHCRARECHTSLPWSEVFVCITLDPSCTIEDNALAPGPFIARPVPAQPFCLPENLDPETAICAPCKGKNYTRGYCRVSKKHRQVPWSTVYVVLSYDPNAPTPTGIYNNKSDLPSPSKKRKVETVNDDETTKNDMDGSEAKHFDDTINCDSDENLSSHAAAVENPHLFFNEIPNSRTFLVTISHSSSAVTWLDVDPHFISIDRVYQGVGMNMDMSMSPYRINTDERSMFPMYGIMPPHNGPPEIYPPMTMHMPPAMTMAVPGYMPHMSGEGQYSPSHLYPPSRFPPYDSFTLMNPHFNQRQYPMSPPMPHTERIERYHPPSTATYLGRHHDEMSGNSGNPSLQGYASMSGGISWPYENDMMSRAPSMMYPGLRQGPPVRNSEDRQYPSPYGSDNTSPGAPFSDNRNAV